MSQLQYSNENENFISNFVFQFTKKMKLHFRYTDSPQQPKTQPPKGKGKTYLIFFFTLIIRKSK